MGHLLRLFFVLFMPCSWALADESLFLNMRPVGSPSTQVIADLYRWRSSGELVNQNVGVVAVSGASPSDVTALLAWAKNKNVTRREPFDVQTIDSAFRVTGTFSLRGEYNTLITFSSLALASTPPPSVTITAPVEGTNLFLLDRPTADLIKITGTASGDLASVGYQFINSDNNTEWRPANGLNSWSITLAGDNYLPLGTTTIRVRATSKSGEVSTIATRTITYGMTPLLAGSSSQAPSQPRVESTSGDPPAIFKDAFSISTTATISAARFIGGSLDMGSFHASEILWLASIITPTGNSYSDIFGTSWYEVAGSLSQPMLTAIKTDTGEADDSSLGLGRVSMTALRLVEPVGFKQLNGFTAYYDFDLLVERLPGTPGAKLVMEQQPLRLAIKWPNTFKMRQGYLRNDSIRVDSDGEATLPNIETLGSIRIMHRSVESATGPWTVKAEGVSGGSVGTRMTRTFQDASKLVEDGVSTLLGPNPIGAGQLNNFAFRATPLTPSPPGPGGREPFYVDGSFRYLEQRNKDKADILQKAVTLELNFWGVFLQGLQHPFAADIEVTDPKAGILPDNGASVLDNAAVGETVERTYTITNRGLSPLTGLAMTQDGLHASDFTITPPTSGTLEPEASTTFKVAFTPKALGLRIATLHIASNDPDETPFDLALQGTGGLPEIELHQPAGTSLVSGSSEVSWGVVTKGTNTEKTFELRNTGIASLTGLKYTFDGADSADFSLVAAGPGTVSAGGTAMFTVRHNASNPGISRARLLIPNNDRDENPFVVVLLANTIDPDIVPVSGTPALDWQGTGKVTTGIGTNSSCAKALAVQPDGRVVVAGFVSNGTFHDLAIVRYLQDGTLDPTFSDDGVVISALSTADDMIEGMALQGNKILVAGKTYNSTNLTYDFLLARYNADGTLDTTFNGSGIVKTDLGNTGESVMSVAAKDGKIVVAGSRLITGTRNVIAVARYNDNGSLDPTFGTGGVVTTSIGTLNDYAFSVAIDDLGRVIAAGRTVNSSNIDMALVRYTSAGVLDTTFGNGGKVVTALGSSHDEAWSLAIQKDGKYVVAGETYGASGTADFALVRYLDTGALDTSFNGTGKVVTSFGSGHDYAYSIAIQGNGKILAGGHATVSGAYDFALARYNTDGSLDTTFNTTGKKTLSLGAQDDIIYALGLESDGRILAAGCATESSISKFAIARFAAGPPSLTIKNAVGTQFSNNGLLSLGTASAASPVTQTVTLTNDGAEVLAGLNCTLEGTDSASFTVDAASMKTWLSPGESMQLSLQFSPRARGALSATLKIASNDPVQRIFSLQLTGTGLAPKIEVYAGKIISPASLLVSGITTTSLGNTEAGYLGGMHTFTIVNTGDAPLLGVSVASADTSFWILTDLTAVDLAPSGSTTFGVLFGPTNEYTGHGFIDVNATSNVDAPFRVKVTGRTHRYRFDQSEMTVPEDSRTLKIPVRLSQIAAYDIVVPLEFSGTASAADYTRSPGSLIFKSGQQVAYLTVTLKDNRLIESDKFIIITLLPIPGLFEPGNLATLVLTITEDDVMPEIVVPPAHQIAATGGIVSFSTEVTGSKPMKLTWKKDGVPLKEEVFPELYLGALSPAQAGAYTLVAGNQRGAVSRTALLAVVDKSTVTFRANAGTNKVLMAPAFGSSLTYQWRKGGVDLHNDLKYGNVTKSTLTIRALTPADSGGYTCMITNPGGSLESGTLQLQVPAEIPVAGSVDFPEVYVFNRYQYQLPYDTAAARAPTRFLCANLPPGLTCNAYSGVISGKPTKIGDYSVKVQLSNSSGPAVEVIATLKVHAFPSGAAGSFTALVDRSPALNANSGGRLEVLVNSSGSLTGRLRLAGGSYSLVGMLQTAAEDAPVPAFTWVIPRRGQSSVRLTLRIDPATSIAQGEIAEVAGLEQMLFGGPRNPWAGGRLAKAEAARLQPYSGYHTFAMTVTPAGRLELPDGRGYGTFSVSPANSAWRCSGRLADNTAWTTSGFLGADQSLALFQSLHGDKGSIVGFLMLDPRAPYSAPAYLDGTLYGAVNWQRPPLPGRIYPDGFGVDSCVLEIFGGRYAAPRAPALLLDIAPQTSATYMQVQFGGAVNFADVDHKPDVEFLVMPGARLLPPPSQFNTFKTSLKVDASTGIFRGGFTLSDPAPWGKQVQRFCPYQGVIVRERDGTRRGRGYFLLPAFPVSKTQRLDQTRLFSGDVVVQEAK